MREKKFFAMKVGKSYLGTIEFLDTHVRINNPHCQSSEIIIFLSKYYIVISDTLVGSFLDVLFLLLAVILSEFHEKARRKDLVTAKGMNGMGAMGGILCDDIMSKRSKK